VKSAIQITETSQNTAKCLVAIIGGVLGAIRIPGDLVGGLLGYSLFTFILFKIVSFILKEKGRSDSANKFTITPYEEKDKEKRIENIEEDIQNKIANLDDKIRGELHIWADE
jgi:hypothetical protein